TGLTAVANGVPLGPLTEEGTAIAAVTGSYAYPAAPLPPVPVREPRDARRWWIPLLAALLVVAAVVGGLLLFSAKEVTVPSVLGAPRAEAEVTLRNRGFDTETVEKASRDEAGTVIGQNPAGDSRVEEGALITLTVSTGPGEATVPDVVGDGRRAARKALTDLGFRVEETEKPSREVGENRVIAISPLSGQRLERGQVVTLTISTGPASATVPDVLRQSREAAREALGNAGFEVAVREEERDDVDPGTVVRQDPGGGQRRPQGSTVTITVAKEPSTVTVPDVTGRSDAEATGALAAAGFEVSRRMRDTEDPDQDGEVIAQSPGGDAKAMKGSTVTITVASFDDSQILPEDDTGATGTTGP
ncbi:MAG: pknB, partial [Solirubrobacterales bacterium]|nr:pknB [Solirubrobacterales bacterium]